MRVYLFWHLLLILRFGGNCDCRYGILYAPKLGWFLRVWLFWQLLLILRNFLFPAGVGLPPGFCYVFVCVGPAHLVFLWEREQVCEMYTWVNYLTIWQHSCEWNPWSGEFVLERPSSEAQSISIAMKCWSVEHRAFAVETYF